MKTKLYIKHEKQKQKQKRGDGERDSLQPLGHHFHVRHHRSHQLTSGMLWRAGRQERCSVSNRSLTFMRCWRTWCTVSPCTSTLPNNSSNCFFEIFTFTSVVVEEEEEEEEEEEKPGLSLRRESFSPFMALSEEIS